MTEFKHEPIKQVIIHDIVHETLDNFLYLCLAKRVLSVKWVDGIMLEFVGHPSNIHTFKKDLQGIKIWQKLIFVKYPKYTKTVKWNGGNFEVALLNYKNNQRFRELAKWIKAQPVWKLEPE